MVPLHFRYQMGILVDLQTLDNGLVVLSSLDAGH